MKGKNRFTEREAGEIRTLLNEVRGAAPGTAQKLLRDRLRAIQFYISDWSRGPEGFTASDFDALVARGLITIASASSSRARAKQSIPRASRGSVRSAARAGHTDVQDGALRAALTTLSAAPISVKEALAGRVPDQPGIYALHASAVTWRMLQLGSPPDARPLYVGKAEASLVARDLRTHFATGKTGQSSPRRSFAALLSAANVIDLVPMPRRPHDPEPKKWTHYALEALGDEQLTDWMHDNLRIATWPGPPGTTLTKVEGEVMRRWRPPLNLIGVSTPWTTQVKDARAVMAAQAKEWAREHGPAV